ncbi:hypothetical protein [Flavobacterium sp.]|uniref:hypothetical protein n=1 Tax=Flavobacterium sp. TaxID=239 RepID=UPI001207BF04|nr:hypothetical protein [Flavobacterium sp.]RZJ73607.1 MAG: hypothetical protein EOO49_02010 [Flavobacterium sp.]
MSCSSAIGFVFLLWTTFGFCQFGIVNDPDGFCNVRSEAKFGKNITDKLANGFVVYVFEPKQNWSNIDYYKEGKDKNGFIYKDRIRLVSDFPQIPLKTSNSENAILETDKISIELIQTRFIPKNHKFGYFQNNNAIVTEIDGAKFFGTDGNIPKREYQSIKITIDGKPIELPKTAFRDLYEPTLHNTRANYDETNDILYVHSSNSDGAGGYDVVWIVEKGEYKTRSVEYGF